MGVETAMKLNYPGLLCEPLPSGNVRYRVRPEGEKWRKISITAAPGHPEFFNQYLAARAGQKPEPLQEASEFVRRGSIAWLVTKYLSHLEKRVEAGLTSHKTVKKKRNLLSRFITETDRVMLIPATKLVEMRDDMISTPAQADAFIEAVRVMYTWAKKRGHITTNPAADIERIYIKGEGAQPWLIENVRQFFQRHAVGSKAHVCMSVLLWTGCRIEDTLILGRKHECVIQGVEALRWQPLKKGSSEVAIPFLPPLRAAVRAPTVQGATYVLGRKGRPYASGDSASAIFKQWCVQADLPHLSAHGVRKALAELLVALGCSQYEIMAILGHSEARTSEVYTRGAERWSLAKSAMEKVDVSHAWL